MNKPELYSSANQIQRHDANLVIQEFGSLFQWQLDGGDRLMDIGCGSGDVTMDFVEPLLPRNYEKLVGSDISLKMIRFAADTYCKNFPKVEFQQLDIGDDCMPTKYLEYFHHMTSFYCLHWIQDQRKVFQNIHEMLTADGDCLLVFVAKSLLCDVYKKVSLIPKWASYMTDVDNFIIPLQNCQNPVETVEQYMKEAGFKSCKIEVREKSFTYKGVKVLRGEL